MIKRGKRRNPKPSKLNKRPISTAQWPYMRAFLYTAYICVTIAIGIIAGRLYSQYSQHKPPLLLESPLWKVVDLPGKGKGVVATRNISQGMELLREKPLFVVPPSIQGNPTALLNSLVSRLSTSQKEMFNSLSSHAMPHAKGDELALARFQTNAISAGSMVGIFPAVARLNHGCSSAFNVEYFWRDREEILVLHAFKPIRESEELLISYTDTKKPRAERRAYLQEMYNFHCQCAVCSLPDNESKASDDRLLRMSRLKDDLGTWSHKGIGGIEATAIINQVWRLGDEEGYWSERGSLAWDATRVAAAHSHEEATRQWAMLAHKWFSIELGADSTQALEAERIVRRPRTHQFWASRYHMDVEYPIELPSH